MEIIGRLTADAKVSTLKDGREVMNFTIAINDRYKPKGSSEIKKITTYINCGYWVSTKMAGYLTKGSLVEVSGRMGSSAYLNMQGEASARLTFHVNSFKLHGGGGSDNKVLPAPGIAQKKEEALPF